VYNSELFFFFFWHGKALGELTVHGEELVGVGVFVMYTYREWIFLHDFSPTGLFFGLFLFLFSYYSLLSLVSFPLPPQLIPPRWFLWIGTTPTKAECLDYCHITTRYHHTLLTVCTRCSGPFLFYNTEHGQIHMLAVHDMQFSRNQL
jgi:hypothetical protein